MNRIAGVTETLIEAFASTAEGVVITDPNQEDNPIVAANAAFYAMTGYREEEIIGRNCRFLQGDATDSNEIAILRTAIANRERYVGELVNHRKDGTPFLNRLSIVPSFDSDGKLRHFVGIQSDITALRIAQREAEQLRALQITMRTVNDIAQNAFTALQYFRDPLAEGRALTSEEIEAFDATIRTASEKLRRIESVERFEVANHGALELVAYGARTPSASAPLSDEV